MPVFDCINALYNPVLVHQTLNYVPPDQLEKEQKIPQVA